MKNIILLFLFLIPVFLFAQYPTTGNKQRLGYQTTGDGLIWRGVAGDTVNKPNNRNYPYFQLDTVNAVLYRFIQTKQQWQPVTGGTDIDSLIYATRYWVSTNFFPLEGGTLTGTGGGGFVGFPSQVTAPGTPASGLNVYAQGSSFNWKGTDGYERLFASTLTGGRTYTLPDVSGTFALGTGTADRSARWSATNTLAAGNFTDNGTKVQALLPFQFQTYTTAGLPTGVTGYHVYNTTTNGPGWYQGSRWAYGLESTFNRGTATYVPYFDANGQITGSADLVWTSLNRLGVGTVSPSSRLTVASTSGGANTGMELKLLNNNASAVLSYVSMDFTVPTSGLIGQFFGTASNYSNAGVNLGSNSNGFLNENNNGMLLLGAVGTNGYVSFNTAGYAVANERMRILANGNIGIGTTSAQRLLHVAGTARITGSVGTATTIMGRDGNGDISILGLGTGLSISSGTLNASFSDTHFANTNLTATGNRTHDWANYNFTWTNMKKFMWGADSLFKITKEFSGYTYSVMRNPSGQTLFDLQGDDDFATNSAEIKLTDTETGNIVFIAHDDRGFGTDGFRIEHYNGSNYHNILFVDKTSRLFHVNQNENSSGTMFEGDAAISDGLFKNIYRNGVVTSASDSITALHFFRAENNHSKNKDVFGVYTGSATADTMYFRLDKVGRLFQYKPSFLFNTVTFSDYGTGTKEAADISKTQSNYIAGFATDGTVLDLERKRDTTIFVTADTDYDFSAAVTTAQISSRYNRVIIHMTLTSGASADKTTTLHTPDANLMQCEFIIRGTDNNGSHTNDISFGTNNAISSDGTNVSGYTLAQGQGLHVRVVYNGSAYKYIYY